MYKVFYMKCTLCVYALRVSQTHIRPSPESETKIFLGRDIKNYEITFFVKPLFRTNLAHRAFFQTKKFSYISLLIFICRKEHAHQIVECLSKKKHKCKQNKSVYERKKYTHQKDNSTRLLTALSIFVLIVNC